MSDEANELDKIYPGIEKQVRFATATTLNSLAKKGQSNSLDAIEDKFTVRGNWAQPSNRFGIHTDFATKDKLESAVKTKASWLAIHEVGGDKPHDGDIAIPTKAIRPNIADKITKNKRPRNLGRAFLVTFKNGHRAIVERVGKARFPLRKLYDLVSAARIKKTPTIVEPTIKAVEQELGPTFAQAVRKAFDTQK